jgi:hydrogenase expression/formation protein HypD
VALKLLEDVFTSCDMEWRGLGMIPDSGLIPGMEYQDYDAHKAIPVKLDDKCGENPTCICGDIMLGLKTPAQCPLFGKACTPENPKGACMVSSEGNCAICFKYLR